jgi:hypothetical protein
MVTESFAPGASVFKVAQRYGVNAWSRVAPVALDGPLCDGSGKVVHAPFVNFREGRSIAEHASLVGRITRHDGTKPHYQRSLSEF